MNFLGYTDPNAGYLPGIKHFVPSDEEYGGYKHGYGGARFKWFDALKEFEDGRVNVFGKYKGLEYGTDISGNYYNEYGKVEPKRNHDPIPFDNRLTFYREDGTKLGKFLFASSALFYFLPESLNWNEAIALQRLVENGDDQIYKNREMYKESADRNEPIYYFDPTGKYQQFYNFDPSGNYNKSRGGKRRKTKARRHRNRRSRRRARRTRRRYYY